MGAGSALSCLLRCCFALTGWLACRLLLPDVLRRCCWHAVLLFMGEEEAFWLLSVVCEDYFSESYTLDMAGKQNASSFFECFPYVCPEPVLAK